MEWLLWTTVILVSMITLAITVVLVIGIMHGHSKYMDGYRHRNGLSDDTIRGQREKW